MASPAPSTPATSTRLGNGELRRMVAKVLADNPTAEYTPREVAKRTGHSSGAIGNAMKTLAAAGHADRTSSKPLRYQANTTTAQAAAGAPPVAPKPATSTPATPAAEPAASRARKAPAAPTGTPAAPARSGSVVTRPNGQRYHVRQLAGRADVDVLRTMRHYEVPVLLYGPPGTGKTSLIEAAYGDLLTVQGDGDTTAADFVGEYTQNPDGTFVFVHGPLIRAMRAGRVLFIDDATLIPPTVLSVVYPAMDGRREIAIKAHGGEVVKAEPGFFVVAGHNPGVHGAILSDALASRFAFQVQVGSDYDLAGQLGVDKRAVKVARNLAARHGKGEVGWAPQLRELLAFQKIATATDTNTAAANLIGSAPEDDRPFVAGVVRAVFGTPLEPLALGPRI
ncbi:MULTISPECIES: AAA family ATPase [Nocardia]|uniref:AAA family ATPase n=1 Tax=Nocardia speluncae TaxID=419477 RepID=A0A846XHQ9_9NOCA|nr:MULTISPECIES: AAA family ATPase [Nocardia]MBF6456060.1 AAA family ATPase [Nocardia cyriacigeorgica]MBF6553200.1 AAA family ATPase [Nocardia cyriacigeorgica]NKY34885.1 AAA family ATPase [Nocardia speluncae]